jgi:hypothetical protein
VIYERLFNWVVECVDEAIRVEHQGRAKGTVIGVLGQSMTDYEGKRNATFENSVAVSIIVYKVFVQLFETFILFLPV